MHRPPNIFLLVAAVVAVVIFLFHLASDGSQAAHIVAKVKNNTPTWLTPQKGTTWTTVKSSTEIDDDRQWEYSRALITKGTGARIDNFLAKAKRGEPFTVSVIGGSVSKGRGLVPGVPDKTSALGADTLYSPENLHVIIFDWLNQTFPHPENRLVNGAQGGVGAGYFSWCFREHVPEDTDLFLVELGINDLVEMDVIEKFENLVRSLLELDSEPAVINLETFTPLFKDLVTSAALHHDVAAFYDLPTLGLRDVLLPRLLENPDKTLPQWFRTSPELQAGEADAKVRLWGGQAVDLMHISAKGHALLAQLVILYLERQLAALAPSRSLATWGRLSAPQLRVSSSKVVPHSLLSSPFDPLRPAPMRVPRCRSANSGKVHGHPIGDDGELGMYTGLLLKEGSEGWTSWAWQEKQYLVASKPGSLVSFDFTIPPRIGHGSGKRNGRVLIGYQRSFGYGLGSVDCWVDEGARRRIDGWWEIKERNMGVVSPVATDISAGQHVLNCQLLDETLDPKGGKEFRIFAIMHD